MFERFLHTDPPSRGQCAVLESFVRAQLAELTVPVPHETLVGVAGTVTTLAAIEQGLMSYSGELVHGARLEKSQLDALVDRLAHLSTAERSQLPGLAPKRADVIVAGAFIMRELMNWAGAQNLVVSDRGVRWGLAEQELLGQRDALAPHGANH
jgi:exopolyphosphatase/guanosine-5'-triphosphate,3'-diphosphate pyrophosphatase